MQVIVLQQVVVHRFAQVVMNVVLLPIVLVIIQYVLMDSVDVDQDIICMVEDIVVLIAFLKQVA